MTYTSDIDVTEPSGQRQRKDCHTHIKEWKQDLYNTCKNLTGEVTATHTEVNYVSSSSNFVYLWEAGEWESKLLVPTTSDNWRYSLSFGDGVTAPPSVHLYPWRLFIRLPASNSIVSPRLVINLQTVEMVKSDLSTIQIGDLVATKIYKLIYDRTHSTTKYYRVMNL